jgi:hypothetical protein
VLVEGNSTPIWLAGWIRVGSAVPEVQVGQLTTPIELLLSAAVVVAILSRRGPESREDTAQTSRRPLFSHPAVHTICLLAGTVAFLLVFLLVIGALQRNKLKESDNQTAQTKLHADKAAVNPNALDNYELMSKSKTDLGASVDGLTPQAKKRMREALALELSGAMQEQNSPVHFEVTGDNHDILLLQLPSMNEEMSNALIEQFSEGDANFWNSLRLINYSQLVFSGDNYRKVVTRDEIVRYSKGYDKYKTEFLKGLKGIQADAQREVTKP